MSQKIVPNEHPKIFNQQYRIAFIGEAPGATEEELGRPFVGASGALLWQVAAKHGIVRDACLVGNVCQVRPPNNKIEKLAWTSPEIQDGLAQLNRDLDVFNPNLVVLLGNTPLKALTGREGITLWRGSLLHNGKYKLLPALHPAGILREYSGKCLLDFDLKRARLEGTHKKFELPVRALRADYTFDEILMFLSFVAENKPTISIDIEGYWDNITCISIAVSPLDAVTIPLTSWSIPQEKEILKRLAIVLVDPSIPKILQNSLYDTFCLQYGYHIPVRGVVDDTMLGHWELHCELPKRLSFLASIYTREPYWKDEREDENLTTRLLYCAKDSAVTYEVRDVLAHQLRGARDEHYRFNMSVLPALLYIEQKGINYDKSHAMAKTKKITDQVFRLQWALDRAAGYSDIGTVAGWVDILRDSVCFKRAAPFVNLVTDVVAHSKLTCIQEARRAVEILAQPLSLASRGELEMLTDRCLNVESKTQMPDFLYRQLKLPVQYKKEKGRLTTKETTDVLALLTLFKKTQAQGDQGSAAIIRLILALRSARTRLANLSASTDPDGRIRCGYNIVGTDTGRLSCYESPTGSGFNLQTATKKDRDLFLPDPEYWLFQCDLSGADGWTVAAHCYALGDSTMLDDYQAGLKPAKILSLIAEHGKDVLNWTRDKIREYSKSIDQDAWMYFARKRVQHGASYGMGSQTMSDQILKDSYKLFGQAIFIPPYQCEKERQMFFLRYPGIKKWQQKTQRQLKLYGYLDSASGHRRTFFGRRDAHDTLGKALADEPQNNTTYACNRALYNLWTDSTNRVDWCAQHGGSTITTIFGQKPRISLRVQPLHLVHDAIVGQFKKEDLSWALPKIRKWFDNELTIAGIKITIPFEGAYGTSWGNLKEGKI